MKKTFFIGLLLLPFLVGSCSDEPAGPSNGDFEEASAKKQFVWEAMNFWYLWQQDVPELGDNYFKTNQAYHDYLKSFTDAEALFSALKYSEDRFSWFIENYEKQEAAFKGISKSFGFSYGLVRISNSSNIFGYVQYILPNSPADEAGLKRGDLFTGINGSTLTINNYSDLLDSDRYVLTMADIENGTISETGKTVTVTAVKLQENPVYMTKVIDTGSVKVGYMVLNAFRSNFHREMNKALGKFVSKGVDQLVLDLRYNGGGAVVTSAVLASMISGLDSTNVFTNFIYNEKRSDLNDVYDFFNKLPVDDEDGGDIVMNKLSLNRVFVLTGFGTASASELLINGLRPYIDVILIGDETVGKDVGSITLYDSPPFYYNKENLNPNHKIALQPIVVRFTNSDGQDYPDDGKFHPKYFIEETKYLADLPPLGSKEDPLLAKALALITGQPQMARQVHIPFQYTPIADIRELQPHGREMYLLPEYTEKLNLLKP